MQTEQEGGSECTTMLKKKERKKGKEKHRVLGAWYYENMACTARS